MPDSTPKTPSKYKRLLTNTAVFTVGKLLSKLLTFFMIGLYTACMTEAEFGTAELITGIANLLIPLACVGISRASSALPPPGTGTRRPSLPTVCWSTAWGRWYFSVWLPSCS